MAGCDSTTRRLIKTIEKNNLAEAKKLLKQSVERSSDSWIEGYPVLCYALKNKNREFAKLLLNNNARVNGKCFKSEGWPLYFAVINQDLEMIKLLLEKGADPDNSNKEMKTVIFYAIEANNIEIVELLLKNKANVNAQSKFTDTPLSLAITKGFVEITKKLLQYKADVNLKIHGRYHGKDESPLHYAVYYKQVKIVELLLKNGANLNILNKDKKSPFQEAVSRGNLAIIKCFLKYGANVNEIFNEEKENCSPLYTALCNTSQKIVELLIKAGANVNGNKKDSEIPLHAAVIKGNLKIVKSLVDLGAKINYPSKSAKKKGYTALHYAAEKSDKKSFYKDDSLSIKDQLSLIEYLISKGANVNAKDDRGKTPLHCAVEVCNIKIIKCLLKHDADINAPYDAHYGYSPLHYACEAENDSSHEVVDLLLEKGADVNVRAKNNYLPIHIAIKNQRVNVVDSLFKAGVSPDTPFNKRKTLLFVALRHNCLRLKIIKTILNYKPNLQNKNNINAFLLAVKTYQNRHDEVVKLLLEYGFRMRPKDIKNYGFIHAAFKHGYTTIINDILQYCTDINMKYDLKVDKGFTLLHSAVYCEDIEIIKLLLKHRIDLSVKDSNGKTAIFYAVQKSNLPIVEQLLIKRNKVLLPIIPDLLSEAVRSKNKEMIELLVQYSDNVDAVDEKGYPPLYYTTISYKWNEKSHYYRQNIQNDKVAKFLLSKGANPNTQTKEGKSILYYAIINDKRGVVENLLLQNADPNLSNNNQFIPLHAAVQTNYSSAVELLLNHKANVNAANSCGKTALHLASTEEKNGLENVKRLLKYKANINCVDIDKITPLHIAAKLDNHKIVKTLLENKAKVNAKAFNGKTPLHFASERASFYCVQELLRFGADVNIEDVFNCTPLEHALESARSQEERGEIRDEFFDGESSNSDDEYEDFDEECFDPGYTMYEADTVVETLQRHIKLLISKKKFVSEKNLQLMNSTVPKIQRFKRSRNSFWF